MRDFAKGLTARSDYGTVEKDHPFASLPIYKLAHTKGRGFHFIHNYQATSHTVYLPPLLTNCAPYLLYTRPFSPYPPSGAASHPSPSLTHLPSTYLFCLYRPQQLISFPLDELGKVETRMKGEE